MIKNTFSEDGDYGFADDASFDDIAAEKLDFDSIVGNNTLTAVRDFSRHPPLNGTPFSQLQSDATLRPRKPNGHLVNAAKRSFTELDQSCNVQPKKARFENDAETDGKYLALLNERFPGLKYDLVSSEGPSHAPKFTYQLNFGLATPGGDASRLFTGVGNSKQKAKNDLARNVLTHLQGEQNSSAATQKNASDGNLSEPVSDVPMRTPAGLLHELDAALLSAFTVVESGRNNEGPLFEATVTLPTTASSDNVLREVRRSKKDAKQALALAVLRKLFPQAASKVTLSESIARQEPQGSTEAEPAGSNPTAGMKPISIKYPSARETRFAQRFEAAVSRLYAETVRKNVEYAFRKHAVLAAICVSRPRVSNEAAESKREEGDSEDEEMEIVAMTTGSKCIRSASLRSDGRAVHDCHAEVLARRAALRTCYRHIEELINQSCSNNRDDAALERNWFEMAKDGDGEAQVRLKPGILFHLYVSTAPCGDARVFFQSASGSAKRDGAQNLGQAQDQDLGQAASNEFYEAGFPSSYTSFEATQSTSKCAENGNKVDDNVAEEDTHELRKSRSLLRAKIEDGEGTIPTARCSPVGVGVVFEQPLEALQAHAQERGSGRRLLTMCCSDKLLKWMSLGFSGALLSRLLSQPLCFHSVVVAAPASLRHIARALYTRLRGQKLLQVPRVVVVRKTEQPSSEPNADADADAGVDADADAGADRPNPASKSGKFSLVLLYEQATDAARVEVIKSRFGYVVAKENGDGDEDEDGGWMQVDADPDGTALLARPSCVSSFCLANCFLRIKSLLRDADSDPESGSGQPYFKYTYRQLKDSNVEYSEQKRNFYQALHDLQLGCWVKKPAELSEWRPMTEPHSNGTEFSVNGS